MEKMSNKFKTIEDVIAKIPLRSQIQALCMDGRDNQNIKMARCICLRCKKEFRARIVRITSAKNPILSCGCKKYTHSIPILLNCHGKMIARCYKETDGNYPNYGGRGVQVCQEWRDNYQNFLDWSLSNGWKRGLQLDKDILGDGMLYSPATCCWITRQMNTCYRRDSARFDLYGIILPFTTIAKIMNIPFGTLSGRRFKNKHMTIYELLDSNNFPLGQKVGTKRKPYNYKIPRTKKTK